MAILRVSSVGETSLTAFIDQLNTTTLYKSVYITCNGQTSPNLRHTYTTNSSKTWTATGLRCGASYYVGWNIESSGGSTASGGEWVDTSACPIPKPSPPSWVSASTSSYTEGSVEITWAASTYATSYAVSIVNASTQRPVTNTTTTSTRVNFVGLTVGTSYIAIVVPSNSAGQVGQGASSGMFTMPLLLPLPSQPGTVSLTPSTVTEGRLSVSWGSSSHADDYLVTIYRNNGTYITDTATWSTSTTFSGLVVGWTYYVTVVPRNSKGNGTSRTSTNITMPAIAVRPDNWAWTSSVVSGYNINMTAQEWNNFTARINAFRGYKKELAYSFTPAVRGQPMAAKQYNEARAAISLLTTVPTSVSIGTTITAAQLNALRDRLNAVT